jgi:hypothetical protein
MVEFFSYALGLEVPLMNTISGSRVQTERVPAETVDADEKLTRFKLDAGLLCAMYRERLVAVGKKHGPFDGVEWLLVRSHAEECSVCLLLMRSILAESQPAKLNCHVASRSSRGVAA